MGDVNVIFDRPVVLVGYAANISDTHHCSVTSAAAYSSASHTLTITTQLEKQNNCIHHTSGIVSCTNPCPNILAPQGFGYDPDFAANAALSYTIDMASVSTALAINFGILDLTNLIDYPTDDARIVLLDDMYDAGYIDDSVFNYTNSYFEARYAPMNPIYW
jgi:hypothetical protein